MSWREVEGEEEERYETEEVVQVPDSAVFSFEGIRMKGVGRVKGKDPKAAMKTLVRAKAESVWVT